MDGSFSFLSATQSVLMNAILERRNRTLYVRVRKDDVISRSDGEEIMAALSDEFADNLDDDWEPTEYGRTVSALMAQFNAARIREWP